MTQEKTEVISSSRNDMKITCSKIDTTNIPEENQHGDCFKVAVETMMKHQNYTLVHAVVSGQGPLEGVEYTHAFCIDEGADVVVDNTQKGSNRRIPTGLYYMLGHIEITKEYSFKEMLENLVEYETYGPWDPVFDNYM